MGPPEGPLRFANFIPLPAETCANARQQDAQENDDRQDNEGEAENGYIYVKNPW